MNRSPSNLSPSEIIVTLAMILFVLGAAIGFGWLASVLFSSAIVTAVAVIVGGYAGFMFLAVLAFALFAKRLTTAADVKGY